MGEDFSALSIPAGNVADEPTCSAEAADGLFFGRGQVASPDKVVLVGLPFRALTAVLAD